MSFNDVFLKECLFFLTDRKIFISSFLLPVFSILFLFAIFNNGYAKELAIGIVNHDGGKVSREIVRDLDSASNLKNKHYSSLSDAEHDLSLGVLYGYVYFAKDFESKLVRGEVPEVLVTTNGQYMLASKTVLSSVTKILTVHEAKLSTYNNLLSGIEPSTAFSILSPIQLNIGALYNTDNNYGSYFLLMMLPCVIQMAILNSLLISLYRGGDLYRHQNDYLKNTRIILSKLILHFILGYVLTVVSTELLILNHGTTFNSGVRYSYLSYPFFGVSVICLAMCIFCLSANCESAINLGSIYAGPAMAFMGVTFPILSMPAIGQFLSHIYPSRLYIDHIIQSNSTPFDLTIFFNNIIGYGSFLGLGVVIYIIKTMSNNRE